LIVNADDLGMTAGVNRAIRETHADGVVTSSTLMANGAAFADAIEMSRAVPSLSVGCHVVLVDGRPVCDRKSIPTLLSSRDANAEFYASISIVAARALLKRFDSDELVREIVSQVKRIQAAGVQVSHLDTHKHTHIFPHVLGALVQAARITGVRAIRNPFVLANSLKFGAFSRHHVLWKRYGQVRLLNMFGGRFRERMKSVGLSTPDGVLGVIETGSFDRSLLRRALSDLPDGTWELVCHPGYDDADLRASHTRLLESRERERELLTSAELKQLLKDQSIQLIGYREFVGN
jgi:hopanoid biosynthesis associated protein HpnK